MKTARVTDMWPQLSQKVLVDFINGTEVAGEVVRVRSERKGLLARAGAALTGRGAAENHLIHVALVEGQLTTISWLEALQAAQADSDLALARVARAVKAHRDRTKIRDVEVDHRLDRFEQTLENLSHQQAQALENLSQQQARVNAQDELRWALKDANYLEDVSAIGRAFYVVDRLWWGPFGAFVRRPPSGQEESAQRYVREAGQGLGELLSEILGTPRTSLVDIKGLLRESQISEGPDAETIRFLASGGDIAMSPLHFLVAGHDPAALHLALPRQSSVDRIATRLWSEAKWTAEGRINHED